MQNKTFIIYSLFAFGPKSLGLALTNDSGCSTVDPSADIAECGSMRRYPFHNLRILRWKEVVPKPIRDTVVACKSCAKKVSDRSSHCDRSLLKLIHWHREITNPPIFLRYRTLLFPGRRHRNVNIMVWLGVHNQASMRRGEATRICTIILAEFHNYTLLRWRWWRHRYQIIEWGT